MGIHIVVRVIFSEIDVLCLENPTEVSGQTVFVDVTMQPFSHEMTIGLRPRP